MPVNQRGRSGQTANLWLQNDFRRGGAALIDVLERHRTLRERTLFEPVERPEPPYEIVWCALPTTCLRDLLGDPFGSRVRRDAEPQDAPSIVSEDQQPV